MGWVLLLVRYIIALGPHARRNAFYRIPTGLQNQIARAWSRIQPEWFDQETSPFHHPQFSTSEFTLQSAHFVAIARQFFIGHSLAHRSIGPIDIDTPSAWDVNYGDEPGNRHTPDRPIEKWLGKTGHSC